MCFVAAVTAGGGRCVCGVQRCLARNNHATQVCFLRYVGEMNIVCE